MLRGTKQWATGRCGAEQRPAQALPSLHTDALSSHRTRAQRPSAPCSAKVAEFSSKTWSRPACLLHIFNRTLINIGELTGVPVRSCKRPIAVRSRAPGDELALRSRCSSRSHPHSQPPPLRTELNHSGECRAPCIAAGRRHYRQRSRRSNQCPEVIQYAPAGACSRGAGAAGPWSIPAWAALCSDHRR